MRILTRYVLREFLVPLFYCLVGFLSIYVLFELFGSFSRLLAAHVSFATAAAYFAAYLAPYFKWMAPACLMLATLYTMWNFCRHSEITAMRASGIGFFVIVRPVLFVAFLFALFTAWINESYVPRTGQWAKQFRAARFGAEEMERADNLVYRNAQASRTWNVGAVVADDATALEDVKVTQDYPSGGRAYTLVSDRAEYLDGQWWFERPSVYHFSESGVELPSKTPELDGLSLRCFPAFDERPEELVLQNRDWTFYATRERLRYLDSHPQLSAETRRSYRYDLFAQIASPLAALVITLFAIPAGIATGRQSVFKGVLTALALFFSFYAVTILLMVLAKKGFCPPVAAAFLPHVLFTLAGVRMFWRQR